MKMLMEACIFILLVGFIDSFIHVFSTATRIAKLNKTWFIPSMILQFRKEDGYAINWLKYSIVLEIHGSSIFSILTTHQNYLESFEKILMLTWHLSDYFGLERKGNHNS